MDIYYKYKKLQKACNSKEESIKTWGSATAKKVQQRLAEFRAANNLSEISHLPPPRLHELENNRKGQFAVDLQQPFRLLFESAHDPVPLSDSGGIDLCQVTAVLIIKVEDYHGK